MAWKKMLAIVGIGLAVVLVIGGATVYTMSRPSELVPYEDTLSPAVREQQTQIALALRIAGLNSSMAVVNNGTGYAMYTAPENSTATADDWQRTVLAAMAPLAPDTTTLVATLFVDEEPSIGWRVPTAKVLAYQAEEITVDELEAAVTKTEF